jgi:GNAT superfamily N-acetyltransferase
VLDRLQRWELVLLEKAAGEVRLEVIPPFRAIPGRAGELVGFNYALPVDPLDERLAEGIKRLQALYRTRREPLRIEFHESAWPGLGVALEAAGFEPESRNPLMACSPEAFRPMTAGPITVRFEAADPEHPGRMRAIGTIDGVVGGHASLGGIEGVAELYGVVTEPAFRRRGVASALCSALLQWHFDRGGSLAFLDAENPGAEALYRRLGFTAIGARLAYRDSINA